MSLQEIRAEMNALCAQWFDRGELASDVAGTLCRILVAAVIARHPSHMTARQALQKLTDGTHGTPRRPS